jgi:hypothetical protein
MKDRVIAVLREALSCIKTGRKSLTIELELLAALVGSDETDDRNAVNHGFGMECRGQTVVEERSANLAAKLVRSKISFFVRPAAFVGEFEFFFHRKDGAIFETLHKEAKAI